MIRRFQVTTTFPDGEDSISFIYYALLSVLDTIFSSVIVAPCVVGYWRSVWTLLDTYLTPYNETISASISTAIGLGGHILFWTCQKVFEKYLHPNRNWLSFYFLSRLYTVCFAFICVNGWRGPWLLLTLYTNATWQTVACTVMVGVVALLVLKTLRNASAAPFLIGTDGAKGYFEVLTVFRTPIEENVYLYILDCLFSVIIVGTLVVFVWRGAWVLIDMHIYPEDPKKSAWASLVLGYIIVIIVFCLQSFMRWTCDKLTGVCRILAADLFMLIALFGTINVWRGIWNLLDLYFLPDNPELSCWITHWVCLIILILLRCSNSLLVRGVYIDGEEPGGKCVVFPCYYLRVIFQNIRKNQLKNNLNLTEMALKTTSNVEKITPIENNHIINTNTIILQNHTEEKC